MFWKRGKKNAFILFFCSSTINYVIDNLEKYQNKMYLERFKHWIQVNKNIESAKYLRKFSFTEMVASSDISMEITNLIQSRSNKGDVGEKHYLEYERLLVKWYPKHLIFLKEIEKNDQVC